MAFLAAVLPWYDPAVIAARAERTVRQTAATHAALDRAADVRKDIDRDARATAAYRRENEFVRRQS